MDDALQTYFSYTSYRDAYNRDDACFARRKIADDLQRISVKAEWLKKQVEEGDPRATLAATREYYAVADAHAQYERLLQIARLMEDVLSNAPRQSMHRSEATEQLNKLVAQSL